jgi:peptidoglycan/LPS O-acetylase OafA/YrhL
MGKTGLDSNLDILRSVAVLSVLVTHVLQVSAGCKPGEHLAYGIETYSLGTVGVLLFFVHTSIVLMQSLERARTTLGGLALIRWFYIRRAFRIYPLSICLILMSVTLRIPPDALGAPYRWQGMRWLMANLLLVQNIPGIPNVASPLWSLPYEVQMYLVLPFLFLLLSSADGGFRLAAIFVAGSILSPLHHLSEFVPCFLAGVIAYKLLGHVRPRFPAWLWCPTVVGAVVVYVWSPYSTTWRREILICLIIGVLIPLFRANRGSISVEAAYIAKYSYGIYLCHTPVLWLVYRKLDMPDWQRPIWVVLATAAASVACYHAIERPLIDFGTRLANRVEARPKEFATEALVAR